MKEKRILMIKNLKANDESKSTGIYQMIVLNSGAVDIDQSKVGMKVVYNY